MYKFKGQHSPIESWAGEVMMTMITLSIHTVCFLINIPQHRDNLSCQSPRLNALILCFPASSEGLKSHQYINGFCSVLMLIPSMFIIKFSNDGQIFEEEEVERRRGRVPMVRCRGRGAREKV